MRCVLLLAMVLTASMRCSTAVDLIANTYPPVFQAGAGNGGTVNFNGLAIDAAGNKYVAGTFTRATDFNPGAGADLHAAYGISCYITRFNADNSYAWTQTFGGYGSAAVGGITVANSVVYVVGSASGGFGGLIGTNTPLGGSSFILALDAATGAGLPGFGTGGVQYFATSSIYGSASSATGISVNGSTAYVVGSFAGTNFGIGGSGTTSSVGGGFDGYILAMNATTGAAVSSFGNAGVQTFGGSNGDACAAVASAGNTVYVTGSYSSGNAGIGGIGTLHTPGTQATFVLALNGTTGAAVAGFGTGGIQIFGGTGYDYPRAIAVSGNSVYVTGYFTSRDAGIGGIGSVGPTANSAAFVIALDATTGLAAPAFGSGGIQKFDGTFFGGMPGGESICASSSALYVTGQFDGPDAGIGGPGTVSSFGSSRAYILALDPTTGAGIPGFGSGGVQTFGGSGIADGLGIAVSTSSVFLAGTFTGTDAGLGGYGNFDATNFGGYLIPLIPAGQPGAGTTLLSSPPKAGSWSLVGNAGNQADLGNFLGTLDNQPVPVRTHNIERLRITENGFVGVGTTAPASLFTVAGLIETSGVGGGIKFPDGTVQTTATLAGATGPAGPKGAQGPAGIDGSMGTTGPVGPPGPQGVSGTDGLPSEGLVYLITGTPPPAGFTLMGTFTQMLKVKKGRERLSVSVYKKN